VRFLWPRNTTAALRAHTIKNRDYVTQNKPGYELKKKGERGHYVTRDVRNIKRRCSFCRISCRNHLGLDVREIQRSGFSTFRDHRLVSLIGRCVTDSD